MIQLTRSAPVWLGSSQDLADLQNTFNQQFWLRLPQFLEPGLLKLVQNDLEQNQFNPYEHPGIGKELVVTKSVSFALLAFLFNDEKLFHLLQQICGVDNIQCFTGRIYRMRSGAGHYDSWHDDVGGHRLLAMSLNLATEPHQGGVLQIRKRGSKQVLAEVENTTFGDAIIFKISPELQHRVTAVDGTTARTAFAGWFRSHPSFRELITSDQEPDINDLH